MSHAAKGGQPSDQVTEVGQDGAGHPALAGQIPSRAPQGGRACLESRPRAGRPTSTLPAGPRPAAGKTHSVSLKEVVEPLDDGAEDGSGAAGEGEFVVAGGQAATLLHVAVAAFDDVAAAVGLHFEDRKSTRLNSSHVAISYAVFCLKKKKRNATEVIITCVVKEID